MGTAAPTRLKFQTFPIPTVRASRVWGEAAAAEEEEEKEEEVAEEEEEWDSGAGKSAAF